MIKQIKTGLRLLPYTYGIVPNLALCGGIGLLGLFVSLYGDFSEIGIYFLMAVGMFPIQMLYSLGVSDMVQTSSWKKPIQTSMSVMLTFGGMGVAYLISFLINLTRLSNHAEKEPLAARLMLIGGIIALIIMLYMGFAMKYFVAALILFIATIYGGAIALNFFSVEGVALSFSASTVIGFACLVLGALLQYGVTLLVYRKPIAKRSQLPGLEKLM